LLYSLIRLPPPLPSTLFPYTTLFRSFSTASLASGMYTIAYAYTDANGCSSSANEQTTILQLPAVNISGLDAAYCFDDNFHVLTGDRKSTRLNSSHSQISYAVFCLKKK